MSTVGFIFQLLNQPTRQNRGQYVRNLFLQLVSHRFTNIVKAIERFLDPVQTGILLFQFLL